MFEKFKYLLWSIINFKSVKICPSCNSSELKLVQRKYYFTSLYECDICILRFRHPLEKLRNSRKFYQSSYNEPDGITTLIDKNIVEKDLDFGYKSLTIEKEIICGLLNKEPRQLYILDFGCSWGYQSYEFKKLGFKIASFEISIPRLNFGNKSLELNITNNLDDISNVDIFYSSHVIEHLENPLDLLKVSIDKTNDGGLIFIKCPNGSEEFQKNHPDIYKQMWGLVHPNFITFKWINFNMKLFKKTFFISSSEGVELLKEINNWNKISSYIGPLNLPNLTLLYFK